MKKTILSLGIVGILALGTGNVFAAPVKSHSHYYNPPRMEQRHQPPKYSHSQKVVQKVVVKPQKQIIVQQPRHIAPPPKPQRIAYHPQPYYTTPVYNQGFALKIGNFFLSI